MNTNCYMNTEHSTMSLRGDRASPISSIALNPFFNTGLSRRPVGNKGYSSIHGMSALEGNRSLGSVGEKAVREVSVQDSKGEPRRRTGRSLCSVHNQ